ncbi:MAG: hypothetical protein IT269_05040 [Saprospiraceae bacterium]|nr:hypothetical protein [Saprospiraceae bacterium]
MSINAQKELTRLKEDGLEIEEDKRRYIFHPDINSVRNIQLYRTLLHEIGHFYQYISTEPEIYDKLTTAEKEAFAHHFAEQLKTELIGQKIIPFDRILTKEFIAESNLDISDFEINS